MKSWAAARQWIPLSDSHWTHAFVTFLITALGASILLPFVRSEPKVVHTYFVGLSPVIRITFLCFLSCLVAALQFKLLSPRIGQLRHCIRHPPAWMAAILGWIVVAVADLTVGLSPTGYRASSVEWLGYAGGSFAFVAWYFCFTENTDTAKVRQGPGAAFPPTGASPKDLDNTDWGMIERWLEIDAPSEFDFLGNRVVANRIADVIADGVRSVGIVGRYGSGKSTIIEWVKNHPRIAGTGGQRPFFVSHHSCWGFEKSSSAITEILSSAVKIIGNEVDTFQLDTLPESYRKMFSTGGNWLETISNLIFEIPNAHDQFEQLSETLQDIGKPLIIIVEDIDRNETRNFEIQEILGLLGNLKVFPGLYFILTGGTGTDGQIDFAKLCAHIEYMKSIEPKTVSRLVNKTLDRCLNTAIFPHVVATGRDVLSDWAADSSGQNSDSDQISLVDAAATLLNNPRVVRHCLGRTLKSWQTLCGELDVSSLLALNMIRFGAPECFDFLLRHWDQLHAAKFVANEGARTKLREPIRGDWSRTIASGRWDHIAAQSVMQYILPTTSFWLGHTEFGPSSDGRPQCVGQEVYWRRAINETVDTGDLRDQAVLRDLEVWMVHPSTHTNVITGLTTSESYGNVWSNVSWGFFNSRREHALVLARQVIRNLLELRGSSAGPDSQGFSSIWPLVVWAARDKNEYVLWLMEEIRVAMSHGIHMANTLWQKSLAPEVLNRDKMPDELYLELRGSIASSARSVIHSSDVLIRILADDHPRALYHLVYDSDNMTTAGSVDLSQWAWLGPMLLKAIQQGHLASLSSCVRFAYVPMGKNGYLGQLTALEQLFGDNLGKVVEALKARMPELAPELYDDAQSILRWSGAG